MKVESRDLRWLFVEQSEEAGGDFAERIFLRDAHGRRLCAHIGDAKCRRRRGGFFGVEGGKLFREGDPFVLVRRVHLVQQPVKFVSDLPVGEFAELLLQRRAVGGGLAQQRFGLGRKFRDGFLRDFLAVGPFQLGDPRADVSGLLLPRFHFFAIRRLLLRRGEQEIIARLDRREERLQAVVIFLENRIELVIVAACALHAEAEENIRGHVRDVVQDVRPLPGHIAVVVFVNAVPEKRGAIARIRVAGEKFIARELLLHKAIVGLVAVERGDDVIAVMPRVGAEVVGLKPIALRKAHEVEPVPRPAFAVARAGEEFIDQRRLGRLGLIRCIAHDCCGFFGGRRQAGEIEIDPARELFGLRSRSGRESVFGELFENETVDLIHAPAVVIDLRHLRFRHRLKRPPFPVFVRDFSLRAHRHLLPRRRARPGRAHLHPLGERGDLLVRKFLPLRRHLQVVILVADSRDEQALREIARHDCRPVVAASERTIRRIEHEPAFDLVRGMAVTLEAVLFQDRCDLLFKKVRTLRRDRPKRRQGRDCDAADDGGAEHGTVDSKLCHRDNADLPRRPGKNRYASFADF